ncbi:unnamed protein product [Alopecurus aequalis]
MFLMVGSVDDDAYLSTMNVGSNHGNWSQDYGSQQDWSQGYGYQHEEEVDEDGEGIVNVTKGRAANYTAQEDVWLCRTYCNVGVDAATGTDQTRDTYWLRMKEYYDSLNTSGNERSGRSLCFPLANIAQNLYKGVGKKNRRRKVAIGKSFVLHHCYVELEHEEKWKNREGILKIGKKAQMVEGEEDGASSDENGKRSPTPNSIAMTKRPIGRKQAKEKGKKNGDDYIKESMDALVSARREHNEDRRASKISISAAEERRAVADERKATTEERKVALEEKKWQMEEEARHMEYEKSFIFMDLSKMDEQQKEYIKLCRKQILTQKRMMGSYMGGFGGMGVPPMGGFGGMEAPPIGGYGVM